MQTKLIRIVNKNERYYILNINPTLFGEFCVERIYGAVRYKNPTRKIRNFFSSEKEANEQYSLILKNKISKGYHIFQSYIENTNYYIKLDKL